jgi:AraC-like DNA-binding protein
MTSAYSIDPTVLPQQGMIRIAPISVIPSLLREFDVDPVALLNRYQLDEESSFNNPEATIPFALCGDLMKDCVETTGCQHFGLLVGQRGDTHTLGAIGLLLRNSPNISAALNELVINLDLHDRGATTYLDVTEKSAELIYEVYVQGIEGTDQISDCAMAIAMNIMHTLCGNNWQPGEVRLRHKQPDDIEPYLNFFRCPIKFNAQHSSLVFSKHWLEEPVRFAAGAICNQLLDQIKAIRTGAPQDFKEQAEIAISTMLGKTNCTREKLAKHFSLHTRTLNRLLKESGTSFRELLNNSRHVMARQLLRDTKRSISSIAAFLGYSDVSAFNRAFSKLEGSPPAMWRRDMIEPKIRIRR